MTDGPTCTDWFAFVGPPVVHMLFTRQTVEQTESPGLFSPNWPSEFVVTLQGPLLVPAGVPVHVVTYPVMPRLLGEVVLIASQTWRPGV